MVPLAGVCLALLGSSCAVFEPATIGADQIRKAETNAPLPEKRVSAYDQSLRDFGRLLEAYDVTPRRIQGKVIANRTGSKSIPPDINAMLDSAMNKIGGRVIYLAYDPGYVEGEKFLDAQIYRTRSLPELVISGGITEADEQLAGRRNRKSGELWAPVDQKALERWGGNELDLGYERTKSASGSRIAVDLNVLDYVSQAFLPQKQVSNSILLFEREQNDELSFAFLGSGLGFDATINEKQGVHSALRVLVELSVVELLGKCFDVPYWRCIKDAAPDEELIARNRDEFRALDGAGQLRMVRAYLFLHGRGTGTDSDAEVGKLAAAEMQRLGVSDLTDLWIKLWLTVPIDQARKMVLDREVKTRRLEEAQRQARALEAEQRQAETSERIRNAQEEAAEREQAQAKVRLQCIEASAVAADMRIQAASLGAREMANDIWLKGEAALIHAERLSGLANYGEASGLYLKANDYYEKAITTAKVRTDKVVWGTAP
jgi:hypothetical protein